MKGDMLNRLYERNPETGNYVIQIALDKYLDVFNDWDHSSYRKRDMDPELAYFLEDCSDEVPLPDGLDLVFYLPRRARDVGKESVISGVVKSYYQFYANFERRKLRRAERRMLNHVLVATVLLAVTSLSYLWQHNVLLSTLEHGLTVGGWVFLWEAISFFFLKRSENQDKIKMFDRLANASIYFRYDP